MLPADVTFVAAAYNATAFLEEFFASLERQSYQGFRLVLVDDASDDGTSACAQRLGAFLGDRLQLVRNEEHRGLVATRNAGLDAAALEPTTYLAFLDVDDWFEEDYLLDLYTMAQATRADLCIAGIVRFDHATQRTLATEMVHCDPNLFDDACSCTHFAYLNPCSYAKLFRFESVAGLRFRNILRSEDTCYLFDALPSCSRVAFTNAAHYHYRVHAQALSERMGAAQHASMHDVFGRMLAERVRDERAGWRYLFEAQVFIRSSVGALVRRGASGEDLFCLEREERAWLDRVMPGWRSNPYLSGGKGRDGNGVSSAIALCAWAYKRGCFAFFARAYLLFRHLAGREVRA